MLGKRQKADTGTLGLAVAGNRLGAIRDAKGKSVGAVFANLGSSQKAEVSLAKQR
jgi:hypothetical protein